MNITRECHHILLCKICKGNENVCCCKQTFNVGDYIQINDKALKLHGREHMVINIKRRNNFSLLYHVKVGNINNLFTVTTVFEKGMNVFNESMGIFLKKFYYPKYLFERCKR